METTLPVCASTLRGRVICAHITCTYQEAAVSDTFALPAIRDPTTILLRINSPISPCRSMSEPGERYINLLHFFLPPEGSLLSVVNSRVTTISHKGATYTNFHLEELNRHCRVCGSKLKDRNVYKCQNERYRERLAFLGVDCTNDVQHVHPRYFCNRCYRAAPRQHTSPGSTPITPYLWKEHTESGCQVSSYIKTHLYKKMHRYASTSDPSKGQGGNHLRKGVDHQLVERRCWQTTCTNSCHQQSVQRNTTYKTALFLRTLAGIRHDHTRYVAAGGDIRKAKHFNNVIHQPMFDVELDQVH